MFQYASITYAENTETSYTFLNITQNYSLHTKNVHPACFLFPQGVTANCYSPTVTTRAYLIDIPATEICEFVTWNYIHTFENITLRT